MQIDPISTKKIGGYNQERDLFVSFRFDLTLMAKQTKLLQKKSKVLESVCDVQVSISPVGYITS